MYMGMRKELSKNLHLHIYIYIYGYICDIYITCTHVRIPMYIHMYTYHEINTSGESSLLDRPHLHIWIHIHVCVRILITYVYIPQIDMKGGSALLNRYMNASIYMWVYPYTCICTYHEINTKRRGCPHGLLHECIHIHVCVRMHTCVYVHTTKSMWREGLRCWIVTWMHPYTCECIHIHVYVHTTKSMWRAGLRCWIVSARCLCVCVWVCV